MKVYNVDLMPRIDADEGDEVNNVWRRKIWRQCDSKEEEEGDEMIVNNKEMV